MLEAYYGLCTSLDGAGANPEQLKLCTQALEVFPLDAQLLCALGGYLHAIGRPELAMQSYLTAYRYGQVEPGVWHIADVRDVAAVCYSVMLQLQQRRGETVQFLEAAVRERGESLRLRRRLIDVYVGMGDREAALGHVSGLPQSTPHIEALRSAVRGAWYAAHQNWVAAKSYLNAAYNHGCRDVLCLKWLASTLLAGGEVDAARPILEQEKADPARLPYLYLDCGTEDGLLAVNREFTALLHARKIAYEYHEVPGAHTWDYWDGQVIQLLHVLAPRMHLGRPPLP